MPLLLIGTVELPRAAHSDVILIGTVELPRAAHSDVMTCALA